MRDKKLAVRTENLRDNLNYDWRVQPSPIELNVIESTLSFPLVMPTLS